MPDPAVSPPPADTAGDVPNVVEPSWSARTPIVASDAIHHLVWWSDTKVGFEHRCDRGARGVVICAPLLAIGAGHQVTGVTRPTVRASVLCDDCGLHGFITDGRWADA